MCWKAAVLVAQILKLLGVVTTYVLLDAMRLSAEISLGNGAVDVMFRVLSLAECVTLWSHYIVLNKLFSHTPDWDCRWQDFIWCISHGAFVFCSAGASSVLPLHITNSGFVFWIILQARFFLGFAMYTTASLGIAPNADTRTSVMLQIPGFGVLVSLYTERTEDLEIAYTWLNVMDGISHDIPVMIVWILHALHFGISAVNMVGGVWVVGVVGVLYPFVSFPLAKIVSNRPDATSVAPHDATSTAPSDRTSTEVTM